MDCAWKEGNEGKHKDKEGKHKHCANHAVLNQSKYTVSF